MYIKPLHFCSAVTISALAILWTPHSASAGTCEYSLTNATGIAGTAMVKIRGDKLRIKITDGAPNTLFTAWVDFRNRATGELADDYPLSEGAIARGVAPTFASTAGVVNGMDLDPNGVITDEKGNATLRVKLDYNLLMAGDSPVVGAQLAMQGLNRIGGYWLRMFPIDENAAASNQLVNPLTGLPLLHRATAQGLTVQNHPDKVTHGHTPGVGGVDHSSAYFGDFPITCMNDGSNTSADNDND